MRNLAAITSAALLMAQPALARGSSHAPATRPTQNEQSRMCVSDWGLASPQPLADGRVLFQARPRVGRSYAASFKGGTCRGMHPYSHFIVIRQSGGQICDGDQLRPFETDDIIPGPVCIIDHFDLYEEPAKPPR